jgi:hypothetical protein
MHNKINEPKIEGLDISKKKTNDIQKYPNLTKYWDAFITDYILQEMLGEFPRFSTLLEFDEWLPNPNRSVRTPNWSSGSLHAYFE